MARVQFLRQNGQNGGGFRLIERAMHGSEVGFLKTILLGQLGGHHFCVGDATQAAENQTAPCLVFGLGGIQVAQGAGKILFLGIDLSKGNMRLGIGRLQLQYMLPGID